MSSPFMIRAVNPTQWDDTLRDRVDLPAVVTNKLGPAPGRRGRKGLWWVCPFHPDKNPSFQVRRDEDGRWRWRCWGCESHGDAPAFLMKLDNITFPEAVRLLANNAPLGTKPLTAPTRVPNVLTAPSRKPPEPPPGLDQAEARNIIEHAEHTLWGPKGIAALEYLRARGLADETIRAARPGLIVQGRPEVPTGISIPWFSGDVVTMINVRRPKGSDPKYQAIKGSRRGGLYPDIGIIRPGHPLIVTEGELDCCLLQQELGDLGAVGTLGSASMRPQGAVLEAMLRAVPWYVAMDSDPAGEESAKAWPARAHRVRPPTPFKDWTECWQGRDEIERRHPRRLINLRRWWEDILRGNPDPPSFTWEELEEQRWGPGIGREEPGIVID
jgi:DNA primase